MSAQGAQGTNSMYNDNALVKALTQMFADLTKNGGDLSGAQLKGFSSIVKFVTALEDSTKSIAAGDREGKRQAKTKKEERKNRLEAIAQQAQLIKLRSGLRMSEEREHGDQVRRNIILRDKQEGFNRALNFTKEALTGGFGFQAALGNIVKSAANTTKQFNEIALSSKLLAEAQKEYQAALVELSNAQALPDSDKTKKTKVKDAEDKIHTTKMDMMNKLDVSSVKQAEGGMAENKNTKPIFARLSKLGDFLNKKKVPIGLGIGVAGIFMSIIVKAFSASPLFAAMMKMMKFMVTLILMPIGTLFGALLRPVLIMLLRKFIIPFYSTMMPTLMNLGTQVGNAIVQFLDDPVKYLKDLITGGETEEEKIARQNKQVEKLAEGVFGLDFLKGLTEVFEKYLPTDGTFVPPIVVAPEAWGDDTFASEEDVSVPIDDPFHTSNLPTGDSNDTRTNEERLADDLDGKMISTSPTTIQFDRTKENTEGDMFPWMQGGGNNPESTGGGWGDGSNDDFGNYQPPPAPEAPREMTEAEKDRELMFNNPKAWQVKQDKIAADKKQAEQEAWMAKQAKAEKLRAEQAERSKIAREEAAAALAKPATRDINAVIAAQAARNAQQAKVETENPRFANTPSAGKLSSSLNAGADVGAAMTKNASRGHTMGSSQRGSDIMREYWASRGVTMAAEGFDGMVNSPTMFMAGEAGAEHVKVTPSGQGGGGGNITVNIQNMNAGDDDLRKLKKTILEVIQQSANNRGRI